MRLLITLVLVGMAWAQPPMQERRNILPLSQTTDNTSVLTEALSHSGTYYIPVGTFPVSQIVVGADSVQLVGMDATSVLKAPSGTTVFFDAKDHAAVTIYNLSLDISACPTASVAAGTAKFILVTVKSK